MSNSLLNSAVGSDLFRIGLTQQLNCADCQSVKTQRMGGGVEFDRTHSLGVVLIVLFLFLMREELECRISILKHCMIRL